LESSAFYLYEGQNFAGITPMIDDKKHLSGAAPKSDGQCGDFEEERAFEQRHFSVAEIAAAWNLSTDAVRRLFCNEPGVLVIGRRIKGSKRQYTTLRIPKSVLERVHKRYLFR
jgi:hypothetical protein